MLLLSCTEHIHIMLQEFCQDISARSGHLLSSMYQKSPNSLQHLSMHPSSPFLFCRLAGFLIARSLWFYLPSISILIISHFLFKSQFNFPCGFMQNMRLFFLLPPQHFRSLHLPLCLFPPAWSSCFLLWAIPSAFTHPYCCIFLFQHN